MSTYITKFMEFFQSGGLFMYPLAVCSLLAGAAAVYKFLSVRSKGVAPEKLVKMIEGYISGEVSQQKLVLEIEQGDSVLARLVQCAFSHADKDQTQLKELVQVSAQEEFSHLQNGIPMLDMIINIAPMLGILGTASGLVVVFSAFGGEGVDQNVMISSGIARALNTTIAGLAIAAPSVVVHTYFSRLLEKVSVRMEVLMAGVIDTLINNRA